MFENIGKTSKIIIQDVYIRNLSNTLGSITFGSPILLGDSFEVEYHKRSVMYSDIQVGFEQSIIAFNGYTIGHLGEEITLGYKSKKSDGNYRYEWLYGMFTKVNGVLCFKTYAVKPDGRHSVTSDADLDEDKFLNLCLYKT